MERVNLFDYERDARQALPRMAFDYYASGAHDQITLRSNQQAYQSILLRPRMLRDVSQRSMKLELFGAPLAMPVLVAPMAFQGMAHTDGELATARAASAAGTIMVLSTLSNASMEEVVAAASGPVWFQLYVYKDRALTRALVERAEAAGCGALVLTVDAPLLGTREADVHNRFHLPTGLAMKNLLPAGCELLSKVDSDSGLASYVADLLDPSLSFKDIEWLRSITRLPLLVKGILRPDDAVQARDHGASGIVVSNHGGRQLDTAIPTIEALPAIADAVGDDLTLLIDGGVRRGTDVLKALALGAQAVLLGRPVLWGLALGGEQGAREVLALLGQELDLAMALSGCRSIAEIQRDLIARA